MAVEPFPVSMPSLTGKFNAGRHRIFSRSVYHIDTGANISCISQAAYSRDHVMLKAAGAKLLNLQDPMRLDMFNKSGSVVHEVVTGAELEIGSALYTGSAQLRTRNFSKNTKSYHKLLTDSESTLQELTDDIQHVKLW